jgi:hypothetical protein
LSECHVRLTLPKFARFTIKKGATEPEYSGQQTETFIWKPARRV